MKHDNNKYLELRNRTVVKANDIIQRSRFSLSLIQQRVIIYLLSHITPQDEEFQLYEFSIVEFCKVCGMDYESGKNYEALKQAIKDISDKSMWIELPNGDDTLVRWIEKPYISKKSGIIRIKLDEDLKPYLLQLKRNFTQYELVWTLHFKSKYTIRLYELVKSIHFQEGEEYTREFSMSDIRRLLDAENYTDYKDLRKRVIDPAVKEINRYSDKFISYEPIRSGKSYRGLEFTIYTKEDFEIRKLREEVEEQLGWNQMSLWDEM